MVVKVGVRRCSLAGRRRANQEAPEPDVWRVAVSVQSASVTISTWETVLAGTRVFDSTRAVGRPLRSRPTAAPARGRRLGTYRLVERVGRGRQAEVWRAVGNGSTSGEVALKLLPTARSGEYDPRRLAQLRREAERGARLVDPALLPALDYGESDGMAYLAMPLVVGCTLGDVLDQRKEIARGNRRAADSHPLAAAEGPHYIRSVATIVARVARAAHVAHTARVAHRDIKPANVLVRGDFGAAGGPSVRADAGVYLCDFGLARDLDVATPGQLRDGAGSPIYMAPERLRRQAADEVLGDVYALGVTLYESLTLRSPFELPADLPRSLWAERLAASRPKRVLGLSQGLPAALDAVVHRAMNRFAERRHPTASSLAADLEGFLSATQVA